MILRRRINLVAAGVLAAAAGSASVGLAAGNPLRVALGLMLVLWLPGYALACAALSNPGRLDGQMVLLSVGLSVTATIVAGLVLNTFPFGLTTRALASALAAITVLAAFVALWRRHVVEVEPELTVNPSPLLGRLLVLGVAVAVVVLAIASANHGARTVDVPRFSELTTAATQPDGSVRVAIDNREGHVADYRLEVRDAARRLVRRWNVQLRSQAQWTAVLPRSLESSAGGGTVLLYLRPDDRTVYRSVSIPTIDGKRR
jgi:hypothetical protein